MSGLKEVFNSQNPEMHLVADDGFYILKRKGLEINDTLALCVTRSSEKNNWGYWDTSDDGIKEWVVIDVPVDDEALVKREVPYTPQQQAIIDQQMPYYLEMIQWYDRLFFGENPDQIDSD
jgi:hypothetical protein